MKRKILIYTAYTAPILLVIAVMWFNIARPVQVLPRVSLGPGFGLTTTEDDLLTNEMMRGKVVLYGFTYTNCGEPCDVIMRKMETVRAELAETDMEDVEFEMVSISIDPVRDTTDVLAEYATQFGATPESNETGIPWHFTTGAKPELVKIIVSSGFDLYHEQIEAQVETNSENVVVDDYDFKFIPMLVLIDGWGIIRAEYRQFEGERLSYSENTSDIDPVVILRDVGLVVEEINNRKGVGNAAYEAAHLFACYPP